jgi:DNA polymerase elongation subunit (family B)
MALVFHCLDILTRDQIITREDGGEREVRLSELDDEDTLPQKYSSKEQYEYLIHIFGKTAGGKTVRVDVQGFRPYFYIRIPGIAADARRNKLKYIQSVKDYIQNYCKSLPLKFIGISYTEKKLFYGYTCNAVFPFIKIDVPSAAAFRLMKNLFLNKVSKPELRGTLAYFGGAPEVYEANIDPMLRFLHNRNLKPCSWMSIPPEFITTETETSIIADVEWEDVSPAEGPMAAAQFKVASWDIETYSSTGDFTLAKKDYQVVAKWLYQRFTADQAADAVEYLIGLYYGEKPLKTKHPLPKREVVERRCRSLEADIAEYLADESKERRGAGSAARNEEALTNLTRILNSTIGQTMPLAADPIIQIGTTLAIGQTQERHIFVQPSCAPVEGAVLHVARSERDLILSWCKWIVEVDPDILIGYNIFGFDERYIWDRAVDLGISVRDEIQGLNRLVEFGAELKLHEKRLSSSALGDNFLYMWSMEGRLQVDVYHYIKRIAALPSYKLDFVTGHFMSGKIQTLEAHIDTPTELLLQVKGGVGDVRMGRSIILLDENGEPVTDKMEVLAVTGKSIRLRLQGAITVDSEERTAFMADLDDAEKWAIVKDDLPAQELFLAHEGSDEDRARIAKYCVQDCDLVMELYKKLEVFMNAMSMGNVCSVPIGYIFTRGQGIKIESLMYKEAALRDQLIIVLPSPMNYTVTVDGEEVKQEDSYEGAIVLDPVIGLQTTPVGVADFASLYPSTIVSENISHDMLVWVKDYDHSGKLMEVAWGSDKYDNLPANVCRYTDIEFDLLRPDPADKRKVPEKIAVGRRICRYAQPSDNSKGTVPQIIQQLLAARKAKRNEAAKETDPLRQALLDTEQNAYKITANSLYGQLGSSTFKIRLQHLAASVTGYGRKQIMFAKEVIEAFYGPAAADPRCATTCEAKVVYGDTDSLFVTFSPRDPETGAQLKGRAAREAVIALTEEAGHLVTQALKPPHDFEFDKVFDPLLMFSKKRYAGRMYESNPDDYVYKYMGIALKRRDNAPIVKMIYGAAMKKVLDEQDVDGAAKIVMQGCKDLVAGKYGLGPLTITKSLRADYADPQRIAHKALADRMAARDPGNAPAAGDRIPYVYIMPPSGQQASKLQGDRIEAPSHVRENKLKPDYEYYIHHQLTNPISQMFAILLEGMSTFNKSMYPGDYGSLDEERKMRVRESIAADLLFRDSLQRCSVEQKRAFVEKHFGFVKVDAELSAPKKAAPPQRIAAMKQQSLMSYFNPNELDAALIKTRQATRKKEQNKK